MIRYRLDTNVLLRFMTHDDAAQADKADALFERAAAGDCLLLLDKIVLTEAVWVLRTAYDQPRERIAETLGKLIIKPGIRCEGGPVTLDALYRYKTTNLDIVDCFLAAQSAAEGDAVATFDTGFARFPDVQLWDPEGGNG